MLLSKQLMVLIDFHSVFIFPYYENIYFFVKISTVLFQVVVLLLLFSSYLLLRST